MLLLSSCLLFFHLKISQLLASVFFPLSPWAANCPHLSNLTPVCNFTFLILYSLSLFVFFTAFSHDIAVFSEVQAKVMQLLYGKTQPVIGDSQAPQGSLPELEFKQSLFLYFFLKMDISYSIAIICLSILLSAIKKKEKKVSYLYIQFVYIHFQTLHVWYLLYWSDIYKAFQPSYSYGSPGALSETVNGLEKQGQIQSRGHFACEQTFKAYRTSWERGPWFLLGIAEMYHF